MSLRLTRKGFITSLDCDPSMVGLLAYRAGRRAMRDAGGHGGGGDAGGDAGGDDTPPDEDDGDDEESDENDESEDDDESAKDKKNKKKSEDDDEEEVVPKWKHDKTHARMVAADKRSSDLQKEVDRLKSSANLPDEIKKEIEELRPKIAAHEKTIAELTTDRDQLRIKIAFLGLTDVEWEDADTALKLADLSDVDISDDGKVDKRALRSALRLLAKEKPYLVKKKAKSEDENEDGKPSGTKMAGRRKGSKDTTDREALKSRFAVLNRMG
jgi:hypothetical protein